MSAISAIRPSRPQGPSRGAAKGNPLALIAAAIGTLLLTLAFITAAPLTAAAQPKEGSAASYMGYTHHDPETKIRTLHINEHSAGLAPTRDNLVYCFNSKLLFPPAERNDYSWKRHYDTDLTHFASYKRSDLNEKVLAVMYSGYSSNPKRIENRANLGLHNDAEFYAATQMAIWILTDYKHVDDSAWKNAFGERMPDIKKAAQRLVSSSAKAPENAKLEIYAPDDSRFQNLLGINFIQKDSGEKFYAPISGGIDTLTTGGETVETTVEDSATESTGSSAAEEIEDSATDTAVRGAHSEDQTIETVEETVKEEEKTESTESTGSHVVEYSENTSSDESVQSNLVEHSEDTAAHTEVRGAYSSDQAVEHTEDTNVATGSRDAQDTSKTTEPTESQDTKKADKEEESRESVETRESTDAPKGGDSKSERENKTEIVEKSEKREKTVKTTEPAPKTSSSASATTTISAPTPATATTAPATTPATAPEARSAATAKSTEAETAKPSASTITTTSANATTAPSHKESKSESKQSNAAAAASRGTLAQTGVEAWALIGFAALAIAGGVLLVWTKKRES